MIATVTGDSRCQEEIAPGDRYLLLIPGLPIERQPDVVHTVAEISDGFVRWEEGGRSGVGVIRAGHWRRLP